MFHQGISYDVYEWARQYCLDYEYPLEVPLAIGVDDTALLKAICPFLDPITQTWFALGLVSNALEVPHTTAEEFHPQIEISGQAKADKLCLWTLQIHLPHVPPAVIAVAAILSQTSSTMLAQMDEDLLCNLMQREEPLYIISLGSDGAVLERKAHQELMEKLICSGEGEIIKHCIEHPDGQSPPVVVPLFRAFRKTMTTMQDSKHCQKTMCNNLFQEQGSLCLLAMLHFTSKFMTSSMTQNIALSTNMMSTA